MRGWEEGVQTLDKIPIYGYYIQADYLLFELQPRRIPMIRSALFAAAILIVTPCFAQEIAPDVVVDSQASTQAETVTITRADLDRLCANWKQAARARVKTMLLLATQNSMLAAALPTGSIYRYEYVSNIGPELRAVVHVNQTCRK